MESLLQQAQHSATDAATPSMTAPATNEVTASFSPPAVNTIVQPPPRTFAKQSSADTIFAGVMLAALAALVIFLTLKHRRTRDMDNTRMMHLRDSQLNEQRQQNEYHTAAMRKVNVEHELALSELRIRQAELGEGEGGGVPRAEMNKLVAKKMGLEIELLTTQLELARRELALRGDQLDFHDVQMERARLEIESLKLRIKEQRKGLDDYSGE